jgi:hypothetical protein
LNPLLRIPEFISDGSVKPGVFSSQTCAAGSAPIVAPFRENWTVRVQAAYRIVELVLLDPSTNDDPPLVYVVAVVPSFQPLKVKPVLLMVPCPGKVNDLFSTNSNDVELADPKPALLLNVTVPPNAGNSVTSEVAIPIVPGYG